MEPKKFEGASKDIDGLACVSAPNRDPTLKDNNLLKLKNKYAWITGS
jgi:hypothetical protein